MSLLSGAEIRVELLSGRLEMEWEYSAVELLFVLDGNVEIVQYHQTDQKTECFLLPKNTLFLVNFGEKYRLHIKENSLLCRAVFPYYELCALTGKTSLLFWCNSLLDEGSYYRQLREYLKQLLSLKLLEPSYGYRCQEDGLKLLLAAFLLDHFLLVQEEPSIAAEKDGNTASKTIVKDNLSADKQRLALILQYIHTNYQNPINLSDLAERLYLSPSTLSRFFTRMMGESFVDYVKKLRLERVADNLLHTDEPVTRIAVEQGFSNPSIMNKAFREQFGITPSEYRQRKENETLADDGDSGLSGNSKQREHLKKILATTENQEAFSSSTETVSIPVSSATPYKKWVLSILSVGAAHDLTTADMQQQILELADSLHPEYFHIWNLFSRYFYIHNPKINAKPNFDRLDSILDFCVEHNLKLFLDLSARRDVAMVDSENSLYNIDESIEFSSQKEWGDFLSRFLRHILHRYGREVVESWVYEFSFFLNNKPFYLAERYSSREAWEYSGKIIKNILPGARIAGPGLIAWEDEDILRQTIDTFLNTNLQPDFFTLLLFPYRRQEQSLYSTRITNQDFFHSYVMLIRKLLEERGYFGQLCITDWSNSLSNRNYIQDSCYRGTYILKTALKLFPLVDKIGFWYASDLINVYYDSHDILNGSSGLLTKNGIKKPAFYAFQFLNNLGTYKLAEGENYLVTTDGPQDFKLLFWNMADLSPSYYLKKENTYELNELESLFWHSEQKSLSFTLSGLEDGNYIIRQKILNQKNGSVLDEWREMGHMSELLAEEIQYLRQTSQPKIEISKRTAKKKVLQLHFELLPHEMRWVHIYREGEP